MEVKAIKEGTEGDQSLDEAEARIQQNTEANAKGGGAEKELETESK